MALSRIAAAVLTATVASGLPSPIRAQGSLFTTAEVDQKLYFRVVTPDYIPQTYENDMSQPRQAKFDSGTTGGSETDGGNQLWSTW